MNDRDMMYGGYYQMIPNNLMQYNFGCQGLPINPMNNGMYPNSNINDLNSNYDIINLINRITELENKFKLLEQKIDNNDSFKDDNSMYMI